MRGFNDCIIPAQQNIFQMKEKHIYNYMFVIQLQLTGIQYIYDPTYNLDLEF